MEKLLLMKKCQNKKCVDTLLLHISCVKLATFQNTKTTEKIPFDFTVAFRRDPKDDSDGHMKSLTIHFLSKVFV